MKAHVSLCTYEDVCHRSVCGNMCQGMHVWVHATRHMWRVQLNMQESVLSIYYVKRRIGFRLSYLHTLRVLASPPLFDFYLEGNDAMAEDNRLRNIGPNVITVNTENVRFSSYHRHLLSSESFRLLSLCPSLYLLHHNCKQKP